MGNAAALFFSSNSSDQTLYRRISPTDKQFEEQQERWNDLADFLLAYLRSATELPTRSWLQGSYKFGTQIRPPKVGGEFDIDLGLYLEWDGYPSDGPIDPRMLMDIVREGMREFQTERDDVIDVLPIKTRCCRIKFEGDFHIDVPAYHLNEADTRSLATSANQWEDSDPKAIYLWFKNKFEDYQRAKVRRQIQYFKMWAALKCAEVFRPSSIMLTVLLADAYVGLDSDETASDDECFCALATAIHSRLKEDASVSNPANTSEDLNRLTAAQSQLLVEALSTLVKTANLALAASTRVEAAEVWAAAFDQFFPSVEEEEVERLSKSLAVATFDPIVGVEAVATNDARSRFTGTNKIGPIPKKSEIFFTLLNANLLPPNSTISWTVRNEGDEAELTNDLGHRAGVGPKAKETSAYKGRHFMDVAVFQHNRLIGRRRVPVLVSGIDMPPRNLPSKRRFRKI